jgi:hypothetical protein
VICHTWLESWHYYIAKHTINYLKQMMHAIVAADLLAEILPPSDLLPIPVFIASINK